MTNATKYHSNDLLNFVQYMKQRMQIIQESLEYDLTTVSLKVQAQACRCSCH